MELITVKEAEEIIQLQVRDYGVEEMPYERTLGRVLAEPLFADRDLPPFNRATVDGIAIKAAAYASGLRSFIIRGIQAAGEAPKRILHGEDCMEIMTGAAVDRSTDAIIRYEDIVVENGTATINEIKVKPGLNIHIRGGDKKQGEMVAAAPALIDGALLGLAASIGKTVLKVKKLPRVAIVSTGDEMVAPKSVPAPCQLRRSNGVVISAVLQKYGAFADIYHLNDRREEIRAALEVFLHEYDILLLSGGVSMGKFDFVPQVLEELKVEKRFHKVRQRPGKPFWFGTYQDRRLVFAFPGNPVSVFLCLNRYFIPWLEKSLGIAQSACNMAILDRDILFKPPLQYFAQVKLAVSEEGVLMASPFESNGSGDFSNLIYADAFMELPQERECFKKGECYKVWCFKNK